VEKMTADAGGKGHVIKVSSFELKTYSPTMSVYSLDILKA